MTAAVSVREMGYISHNALYESLNILFRGGFPAEIVSADRDDDLDDDGSKAKEKGKKKAGDEGNAKKGKVKPKKKAGDEEVRVI